MVSEGVNDPGIFKAIFLAGGPGSGKSYVASNLFGIPEKINVSPYGLKIVNQDAEFELLLKKYFGTVELDKFPPEVFKDITGKDGSGLRKYAKELSKERLRQYVKGRLGVIIDGTGHRYSSIKEKKDKLEKLGYDTYMVFVWTDLETALKRNEQRPRTLPTNIVKTSWRDTMKNIKAYKSLFGSNFLPVDNSKTLSYMEAMRKFSTLVRKGIGMFMKKPIKNKIAKDWVKKQRILQTKGIKEETSRHKKVHLLFERADFQYIASELVKYYGLKSKVKFGTSNQGDYDFDNDVIKLRRSYPSVQEFVVSVLHEIHHAVQRKKFGLKKFLKKYNQAGNMADLRGKDRYLHNKWERKAENWAQQEYRRYWKDKF